MTWDDLVAMPQGDLVEYLDQLPRWAAAQSGSEPKGSS